MAAKVLDSWALMAFFEDEPAAEQIEKVLAQAAAGRHRLFLSVVNWGEIYYTIMREASPKAAEQIAREIAALPIELVGLSDDLALTRQAAVFKARHRMAYADCFAAALAKSKNAALLTGDPEFHQVEKEIKVHWLK